MVIPAIIQGRLSIPLVGFLRFNISNQDLVIAQYKAGIVSSLFASKAVDKGADRLIAVTTGRGGHASGECRT